VSQNAWPSWVPSQPLGRDGRARRRAPAAAHGPARTGPIAGSRVAVDLGYVGASPEVVEERSCFLEEPVPSGVPGPGDRAGHLVGSAWRRTARWTSRRRGIDGWSFWPGWRDGGHRHPATSGSRVGVLTSGRADHRRVNHRAASRMPLRRGLVPTPRTRPDRRGPRRPGGRLKGGVDPRVTRRHGQRLVRDQLGLHTTPQRPVDGSISYGSPRLDRCADDTAHRVVHGPSPWVHSPPGQRPGPRSSTPDVAQLAVAPVERSSSDPETDSFRSSR